MAAEDDLHFITVPIDKEDSWCNKEIRELLLPAGMLAVAIRRGQSTILPKGNARLKHGDFLVLGAEPTEGDHDVDIREIVLGEDHDWVGRAIKGLNISRQTFIVIVKRAGKTMIPRGNLVFAKGDQVVLLSNHTEEE